MAHSWATQARPRRRAWAWARGTVQGTWTLVLARPHGVETKFQKSAHKSSCQVWGGCSPLCVCVLVRVLVSPLFILPLKTFVLYNYYINKPSVNANICGCERIALFFKKNNTHRASPSFGLVFVDKRLSLLTLSSLSRVSLVMIYVFNESYSRRPRRSERMNSSDGEWNHGESLIISLSGKAAALLLPQVGRAGEAILHTATAATN